MSRRVAALVITCLLVLSLMILLAPPALAQPFGWVQVGTGGLGNINNQAAYSMEVYNGRLYAGTKNSADGAEVLEYDGASWTQSATGGFGDSGNTYFYDMAVHDSIGMDP